MNYEAGQFHFFSATNPTGYKTPCSPDFIEHDGKYKVKLSIKFSATDPNFSIKFVSPFLN
jgi:hypothetical protein